MTTAVCSECGERPAITRGLCRRCRYRLDPDYREKQKLAARARRAKAQLVACLGCGKPRRAKQGASGLCRDCARRARCGPRAVGTCSTCGATDAPLTKGQCEPCYKAAWYRARRDALTPEQLAAVRERARQTADRRRAATKADPQAYAVAASKWRLDPAEVERRRAERQAAKAAWTCPQCGEQRPRRARGLCGRCHHALWRSENPEHVKAYDEQQRRARGVQPQRRLSDEERAKQRRLQLDRLAAKYRADPEPARQRSRQWRLDNRERANLTDRAKTALRRAGLRAGDIRRVTRAELRQLLARPCMACGTTERVTIEHLIPLARGGRHAVGNLAPLCRSCNSSKSSLTWSEWRFSDRPGAVRAFSSSGPTRVS